ncbi:MAG: DUF420 domain-containing protein [Verrucomicrobiota bacterium JB022]|nr:DUF420 domain-containing protein [Verrucomicrobiota bacterium JB022]
MGNRAVVVGNIVLSVLIVAFLFWLIYAFELKEATFTLPWLPSFNAACNALSTLLVAAGIQRIYAHDKRGHGYLMAGATAVSGAFLVGYLLHHTLHGDTRYLGTGLLRPLYFVILITHIIMATLTLPLVTTTLSFAALRRFDAHRRIARWTYPCWLYVSITGVVVYVFLRWLNPAA